VTSPQAFDGLRKRGIPVFNTSRTTATADHNVPTKDQHLPIKEALSRHQVETLRKNCAEFGVELYDLGHPFQGIVHIIGPELGLTLPGMTIVCGDSHTSTHGAFGAVAFGIGTSEVEQVLATQCILQSRPKTMRIEINGKLGKGVVSKDIILYIISKISASGATGYFVEYAGDAIRSLSMEARCTVCNMSIEMGARGGLIAPDDVTFEYIRGRRFAPQGDAFDKAVNDWRQLQTDEGATYDQVLKFDAADIQPMITYGTNPGMGIGITENIPSDDQFRDAGERNSFHKSLDYMGLEAGKPLLGRAVDYVFIGSCTNARIEDLRMVAEIVRGKRKADGVEVWVMQENRDRDDFLAAMNKHRLRFGLLCGGSSSDPAVHLDQFKKAIDRALTMKPLYINCHSGRDHFSFEDNRKFIDYGNLAAQGTGIPVYHETHRGRILYSAPVARTFIDRLPGLKLTLDISHWCNVHESLLSDQPGNVAAALERAEHIHARIGHAESPQVSDPRAPEWDAAVKAHLAWWDVIVARKKKAGEPLTILTEFGPADYMPTVPYTRQPLANQWEINVYMKDLVKKRYGN